MAMQRMEQEIKELQAGLGAVVQALSFLQNFLESDYGLKFQFHAYCNSPLYSHNSGVLEILKQKYPGGTHLQETCYNGSDRLYQRQHDSPSETGNDPLIHLRYPGQETIQGLGPTTVMNTVTPCSPALNQNYASNNDHSTGNLSSASHRHHPSSEISNAPENLSSSQRSPIIVNEEELFGMSDLAVATVKVESHGIYQQNQTGIDSFGKSALEDENDSGEEMVTIRSTDINEVTTKKVTGKNTIGTTKRGRAKKEKIVEGYKCPHCRRRCSDRAKLELHMTHHKQQFQCSECGIWLADKSVLNRHMRTHTGDRPFKCIFCEESFSRQDIVKKHMQRKHKGMSDNSQNNSNAFKSKTSNETIDMRNS